MVHSTGQNAYNERNTSYSQTFLAHGMMPQQNQMFGQHDNHLYNFNMKNRVFPVFFFFLKCYELEIFIYFEWY